MRKRWSWLWLALWLAGCSFSVAPVLQPGAPDGPLLPSPLPQPEPVAPTRPQPLPTPAPPAIIQPAIDQLVAELPVRSPGTDLSIAVRNLVTGESGWYRVGERHVSASAVKPVWVAAALAGTSVVAVTPYATQIFKYSDNYATGAVIDLVGIDAVNVFYQSAGLTSSAITQWSYGGLRVATNSPRAMGSDNYVTAADALAFLHALDAGTLLAPAANDAFRGWMLLSPRTGFGGWLGTLLPSQARTSMRHKAGWLTPGCCSDDALYNTVNELGIVETAGGARYAIVILARRGDDWWDAQAPFVEHASCVIYRAIANDAMLDCT
jgi:beta-lactamase class A